MEIKYYGQDLSSEERDEVTIITISDKNMSEIEAYAFSSCTSLTQINLHNDGGLKSIDDGAFSGCESLTHIHLPEGITDIGEFAFAECASLTHIHFPESVENIGAELFSNCESLVSVQLPEHVASIGDFAFIDCDSLEQITLPRTENNSYGILFCSCSSLEHIHLPKTDTVSIEKFFLYLCPSITTLHIPKSVTRIGAGAFTGCPSLLHLYIPKSVVDIEPWAFKDCESLVDAYDYIHPLLTEGVMNENEEEHFRCWLRTRYDEYPFLTLCWNMDSILQMEDRIYKCIKDHGIECMTEVEECSGINGFDILLSNPNLDGEVFDIIANIIVLLWDNMKYEERNPQTK